MLTDTLLPSGLRMAAEFIPSARSLAMTLCVPAGTLREAQGCQGSAAMLSEWVLRGAGDLDAREHSDALDRLGVSRAASAGGRMITVSATMLAERAAAALPLLLDIVLRPQLPDSAFEPTRSLALQDLDALEDEPQQKVYLRVLEEHLPPPLNRNRMGVREHVQAMTPGAVRDLWRRGFVPGGAVLTLAGGADMAALIQQVGEYTRGWSGSVAEERYPVVPRSGYTHETVASQQVHLGLAYPALPAGHEREVEQQAAVAVLSGGMSGRLFTEVREKRALVYAVHASVSGDRDYGCLLAYAGTTTPRAAETYDVLTREIQRLAEGLDRSEFDRAVIGMKSRLVRQGESTSSRAAALAGDLIVHGRPRALGELTARIDALTHDNLQRFVADHPYREPTVVTLGAEALPCAC